MTNPTSKEKWTISAWSVLAVILIFNPVTYRLTNKIFSIAGAPTLKSNSGPLTLVAPTWFGLILHFVVFFALVRGMMEIKLPGVKDDM